MKETLKYLAGIAGPSGYGSKSTAEQVTQDYCCSSSAPSHRLTAIITDRESFVMFKPSRADCSKETFIFCFHGQLSPTEPKDLPIPRRVFQIFTEYQIRRATSGIGAETARVLAKRGVKIVMPARDLAKAVKVKEGIERESPKAEVIIMEIDLSSLTSVNRFCSQFLALRLPLNILINNGGIFSKCLEYSEDKIEMTFATNYLGHHFLTEKLLEKMVETAAQTGIRGRIINVSSVIHSWVKRESFSFNQLLNPKNYNGTKAYAQSKLANILHVKELAKQLKARNARVTINAVHPGIVKTGIIRAHKGFITDSVFFIASKLLKTTSQGASTACYVALSPELEGVTGKYFADCNESECSNLANDESEPYKLWKQTRILIHRRLRQPPS